MRTGAHGRTLPQDQITITLDQISEKLRPNYNHVAIELQKNYDRIAITLQTRYGTITDRVTELLPYVTV